MGEGSPDTYFPGPALLPRSQSLHFSTEQPLPHSGLKSTAGNGGT